MHYGLCFRQYLLFGLEKFGGGIKKPLWSVLGRSGVKLVGNSQSCPSALPHVPQDRPIQSILGGSGGNLMGLEGFN